MQSNKANSNVNAACSPVHGHLWGKKNATLHNSAGLVIVLWLPQNDVLHSLHTHTHNIYVLLKQRQCRLVPSWIGIDLNHNEEKYAATIFLTDILSRMYTELYKIHVIYQCRVEEKRHNGANISKRTKPGL